MSVPTEFHPPSMLSPGVRTARAGHGLIVQLARPEVRNALSSELLGSLRDAIAIGDADDDVSAIIVTGADPAFSAGLDLDELARGHDVFWEYDLLRWFRQTSKPVVAAVNGPAITGGFELALACDVRIASERAWFADTHTRMGVVPGWGMTANLTRSVGPATAYELSMSGRRLGAAEALRTGLVQRVVPHESLLDEAVSFAESVAEGDAATRQKVHDLYREQARRMSATDIVREADASRAWQQGLQATQLRSRGQAVRGTPTGGSDPDPRDDEGDV